MASDDGRVELAGPLPVTADEATHEGCVDWATGPYASLDLWRFHATNESSTSQSSVVDMELEFENAQGQPVTKKDSGSSVATEHGWTLIGGTAALTTNDGNFELAGTCIGRAAGNLAPLVVPKEAPQTEALPKGPQRTPTALAAGTDVGATVTVGSALVLAGMLLLIVRRRPRGQHRMKEKRMNEATEVWRRAG